MELITIKITGTVVTSRYGTLTAGDLLRTDTDFADHLVGECHAAKYIDTAPAAHQESAPAPRRRKGKE